MKFFITATTFMFLLSACTEIKPVQYNENKTNNGNYNKPGSITYQFDGNGGLFNNIKWYKYEFTSHSIWSLYDVFAIKAKDNFYKVQIVSYFGSKEKTFNQYTQSYQPSKAKESGYYTLRISKGSLTPSYISFHAKPCGDRISNPFGYADCIEDKDRNKATYLNLETGKTWQMTDAEALLDTSWDMSFNTTKIKLNGGSSGPSNVVGALAFRNSNFFDADGEPIVDELLKESKTSQGADFFDVSLNLRDLIYYPMDGLSRVISEKDWFKEASSTPEAQNEHLEEASNTEWKIMMFFNDFSLFKDDAEEITAVSLRTANSENAWFLRSSNGNSFFRFRVTNINEKVHADTVTSTITISYNKQLSGEKAFSKEVTEFTFPTFVSTEPTYEFCLNLEKEVLLDCKDSEVDLVLNIENLFQKKQRNWHFSSINGAFGPMTYKKSLDYESGQPE